MILQGAMVLHNTVNIHGAKTRLSELLARVAQGEEIIIAEAGRPIARLVPADWTGRRRSPGSAKGRVRISPDFTEPLPEELLREFER